METAAHPRFLFKPRTFGMIIVALTSSASLRTGVVKTFRCADETIALADNEPSPTPPSQLREVWLFVLEITLTLAIFLAGFVTPLYVAHAFNPWLGLLTSVVALIAWIYLGPPPMPGLLNGVVCLAGLAGILGTVVNCIVLVIRGFF